MRLLGAPAFHIACAGALLFAAVAWRDDAAPRPQERPRIDVPASRVAEARRAFVAATRRAPTAEEEVDLVRRLVDEEVLVQHALDLGLADQEPVERRLAQIAEFVAEEPEHAFELGLVREDRVIRRILVDSSRRLIRAAVLSREPSRQALEAYLAEHPERFEQPEEIAVSVAAAGTRDGAVKELPLLGRRDLERRYGHDFAEALDATVVGSWRGPLPSRYGPVRVLVREHRPARPAALEEVEDAVRVALLEELAARWLETRIAQLRSGMDVVVAEEAVAVAEVGTEGGAS